jgi:dTDP-4-amino-4,6-dideoxygalactose transaminase
VDVPEIQIAKWPNAGTRERELLLSVLDSPQWGGFHEIVGLFERQFAAYQHSQHAVSTFNGTVSLEMMMAVAGIGPGDEVIVPAISFVSTAMAVSRVGAIPVFVDIEPGTFNLDPERAAAAMTSKTRAILAVHFGGSFCAIESLLKLAENRGIPLFEDAAHAHGSEWNGQRAGSFGLASSFSFQNGKVMTAGEGGVVVTSDQAFHERCRSFANQGRQPGASFFHHFTVASNFRITALQAAILVAQLERLDGDIALRQGNEELIRRELAGIPGLTFQHIPPAVNRRSHYLLLGRIDAPAFGLTRDQFQQYMTTKGIPCTPFYPHPLYGNPMYAGDGCRVEPCPVAEACIQDAFWFPHRVLMSEAETIRALIFTVKHIAGGFRPCASP